MPLKIIRNDIAEIKADAIVNTANRFPVIGSGVDSRIYQKAGSGLSEARKRIGLIEYGDAAVTPAYHLNADYIIHTVSPLYSSHDSVSILRNCYRKSLLLAREKGCSSIAFPVLASGNNGFPPELALQTAISEIGNFLMKNNMMVYLVVFDKEVFALSERLFSSVQSYIDENFVENAMSEELSADDFSVLSSSASFKCYPEDLSARSLDHLMDELDESFSQCLLRLIHSRNLEYPDVYKAANVDRKLFSKIKNNPDYQPKKMTAIAFAIALKLSLDETKDLIGKAGYALTHSSKADIIIEYFIREKNYNIFEINEVLFAFDQNLLL